MFSKLTDFLVSRICYFLCLWKNGFFCNLHESEGLIANVKGRGPDHSNRKGLVTFTKAKTLTFGVHFCKPMIILWYQRRVLTCHFWGLSLIFHFELVKLLKGDFEEISYTRFFGWNFFILKLHFKKALKISS